MEWFCLAFDQMDVHRLYDIMALRSEVFVVEQDCVYQDLDGKDLRGHHLFAYREAVLAAYLRILPPGVSYPGHASLGRIVTAPSQRGSGVGKALMAEAIARCRQLHPDSPIKISAQAYLERFYNGFGFKKVSEPYLEDGIPHIAMIR